ncbi:putative toxin-antitoxin system toxin component, PIN family [Candidatus Nitrospira salsa]
MRLVLDTNILISGLLSQVAPPAQLLQRWLEGRYELATSPAQVEELTRVLTYKKLQARIPTDHATDLLNNLDALAIIVSDLPIITLSGDPADNVILATAVASRADGLVSGDKTDLLVHHSIQGIPIVTARQALGWMSKPGVT